MLPQQRVNCLVGNLQFNEGFPSTRRTCQQSFPVHRHEVTGRGLVGVIQVIRNPQLLIVDRQL